MADTHTILLRCYEAIAADTGTEPVTLVIPYADGEAAVIAFVADESHTLMAQMLHGVLNSSMRVTDPPPWIGLAINGYEKDLGPDGDATDTRHGDLQAAYEAGDDTVRSTLLTVVKHFDRPPDSPDAMTVVSYGQPHLQRDNDEPQPMWQEGEIAMALHAAGAMVLMLGMAEMVNAG